MTNRTEKIVIIGGGPAGLAAAIYAARDGLNPLVFAGSLPGGQPMLTSYIENYPGHEKILGPDLVGMMRKQAISFGARFVDKDAVKVDFSKRPFKIYGRLKEGIDAGQEHRSKKMENNPTSSIQPLNPLPSLSSNFLLTNSVIITTGAKALWLGLPSEQRLIGKGVSACANCDGFFFRDKTVAVVGGGDTAIEEALSLTKYAKKVYVIHRRDHFRASKVMQDKVFGNPKIEVIWNAVIKEVLGESKVEGVNLIISKSNFLTSELASRRTSGPLSPRSSSESEGSHRRSLAQTSTGSENLTSSYKLKLDGLFVAIGYKPDTDLFKGQIEMDEKGYIVTKNYMTSVEGVFAGGDCIDPKYKQLATAIGSGVAAAVEADKWLESVEIG